MQTQNVNATWRLQQSAVSHPKNSCKRLKVFENRVLRRVFGPKRDEVTGEWKNYIMRS
jgi:hypothetical protein